VSHAASKESILFFKDFCEMEKSKEDAVIDHHLVTAARVFFCGVRIFGTTLVLTTPKNLLLFTYNYYS
jgi:hypothetical protein